MFESFQSQTVDSAKIGQTKSTLKYYVSDRFIDTSDNEIAQICAGILIDVATQFRQRAAANACVEPLPPDGTYPTDLCNWILEHVGQQLGGNEIVVWAIALESLADELSH